MSESRAKRERKGKEPEVQVKKNKSNILFNIIVVLVIIAVVGVGGWAVYEKIKADAPVEQTQTIADIAAEEEMPVEELLSKIGLADEGFTGEEPAEDLLSIMTLENFAKFEDKDVEEFKKEYGIENLENDMLWEEAQMNIPMGKIAEMQYGTTFEEFAAQNGFPAEITADMTQGEAVAVMQAQSAE